MGFIDRTGRLVIPFEFSRSGWSGFNAAGYAVVTPLGETQKAIIDTSGEVLFRLPPNYDNLHTPPDAHGVFPVMRCVEGDNQDHWTKEGHEIVYTGPTAHYGMRLDGSIAFEAQIHSFSGGFYCFSEGTGRDKRYGILDATGNVKVPAVYEHIFWSTEEQHVAQTASDIFVLDSHGTVLFHLEKGVHRTRDILRVTEHRLVHWDKDREGCLITDIRCGSSVAVPACEAPLKPGSSPLLHNMMHRNLPFIAEGTVQIRHRDGKTSFLNLNGEPLMRNWARRPIVFPPEVQVGYFTEGLATYRKEEASGYIDRSGTLVIERQFSNARPFNHGLAKVNRSHDDYLQHRHHYIDRAGEIVFSNY